ncbi:ArsR/SmtB family transcription factor [Actinomadura gamaensis]|uniref:ArsR/SmtB family transcription factor n=1 Tax=Actinomadura gamaensis TaxID=1763541 RepID=A0ABV9U0E7_9ACTN
MTTGDELLRVLAALDNPHRLRILAALADERDYVSNLARELGISRPLLQVHLRKLVAAGLVEGRAEVSPDGRAMKYYEIAPFRFELTPEVVRRAARTLSAPAAGAGGAEDRKVDG